MTENSEAAAQSYFLLVVEEALNSVVPDNEN